MGSAKIKVVLLFMLSALLVPAFSQPKLKIVYTSFGFLKSYEIYENDQLRYKIKGEKPALTGRIRSLHGNSIIFEADSVGLDQIKWIRFEKNSYHAKLFQKLFLIAGIGYPALNLFNNSMNNVSPLLSEKGAILSASFLAASFIIYRYGIKRIRFTKNKLIKIVDIDFENLNQK